jgi:hypothetical protein
VTAAMGLKSSPYYQAVQVMLVVKEVIKGDMRDPNNASFWDEVRLNLPGSKTTIQAFHGYQRSGLTATWSQQISSFMSTNGEEEGVVGCNASGFE